MGIAEKIYEYLDDIFTQDKSPQEDLDEYEESLKQDILEIKESIADLSIELKRMESQRDKLRKTVSRLESDAKQYLKDGKDKKARRTIERKKKKQNHIRELDENIETVSEERQKLIQSKEELESQLSGIRRKRSRLRAKEKINDAQVNKQYKRDK